MCERFARQEIAAQRRLGQRVDQGPCPHVDSEDVLPCPRCWVGGGRDV